MSGASKGQVDKPRVMLVLYVVGNVPVNHIQTRQHRRKTLIHTILQKNKKENKKGERGRETNMHEPTDTFTPPQRTYKPQRVFRGRARHEP